MESAFAFFLPLYKILILTPTQLVIKPTTVTATAANTTRQYIFWVYKKKDNIFSGLFKCFHLISLFNTMIDVFFFGIGIFYT